MAESLQVSKSDSNSKTAVFICHSNTPDGVAELRARWEADLSRTELPPPPPEVHATKQEGIDVRIRSSYMFATGDANNRLGCKELCKGPRLCPGHWPFIQGQGEHFCFAVIHVPSPQPDVF
jgi:hypothetical protein